MSKNDWTDLALLEELSLDESRNTLGGSFPYLSVMYWILKKGLFI